MHTLVLDLHGGLPGLGAADVLLYRPRAEGKLAWLSGGRLAQLRDVEVARVGDVVRTHLTRHQVGPWVFVLLLDLPSGGDPLDGSALTDQLDRVQRFIEAPLAARGLRPKRTVALTLDALARDHRGVPTDPAARLRWKLDTHGMARLAPEIDTLLDAPQRAAMDALVGQIPALLDATEIQTIAGAWTVPERPEGVRLDQRLDTLTPELRGAFDAARATALTALAEHLDLGSDSPDASSEALDGPSRFARRTHRLALLDRFEDDLDALSTVADWQAFDPTVALRLAARQLLSLEAITERTTVVRLRLERQPLPALQQSLLHLAYTLVALVEVGAQRAMVKPRQRYVATVSLDEDRLALLVDAYRQRLDRALREVGQRLDEPLVDALPLVRDPDCGCERTLDVRGRFAAVDRWTQVGPVRRTDDLRWDTWADSVRTDLDTTASDADAHIAACIRADAARFPAPQSHRLDQPIEAFVQAEADSFRAKQRSLLASVVPSAIDAWDEAAHTDTIASRLYSRPVGRVVALWTLGGVLLFSLPYLAAAFSTAVPLAEDRLWWLGGVAAAGLLPAIGVLVGRWFSLRRRWRATALAAKEALAAVQARYRLRTDRLAQGCDLRAARQRVDAAQSAEHEAGQQRLRLRHHATQLRHHLTLAESFSATMPDRTETRQRDPVPATMGLGQGLDPDRPAYQNPVYQPTYRPGPPDAPVRFIVNRSEHGLSSPRLTGLATLRLDTE
ncbi:MAG: hypothetical protein AAF624_02425 [Bacteroidota bacterium]